MTLYPITVIAEGLSDQQRLSAVAALLGVLVFGVIVLVAEGRNHSHERVPPGRTKRLPVEETRSVRRPPPTAVPIASARQAVEEIKPAEPYPVPFLASTGPEDGAPPAPPG